MLSLLSPCRALKLVFKAVQRSILGFAIRNRLAVLGCVQVLPRTFPFQEGRGVSREFSSLGFCHKQVGILSHFDRQIYLRRGWLGFSRARSLGLGFYWMISPSDMACRRAICLDLRMHGMQRNPTF